MAQRTTHLNGEHADTDRARVERLTEININDLFNSFRVQDVKHGRWLLRAIFKPAARWFANTVVEYDNRVAEEGLAEAAHWIMERVKATLSTQHTEHIPREGPVLIVANHPGITDTMALAASLPRTDLRYIAHKRPFLQELPNTSEYLIYVDEDDATQRMTVMRRAARLLEEGHTVVTFPGGSIDPDPAVAPGAITALDDWSDSIALFVRRIPQLTVVPTLVHGVISAGARKNPLVKLYDDPRDREWVAATLQMTVPIYRRVDVTVTFGEPIPAEALQGWARSEIMTCIRQHMAALIATHGNAEIYTEAVYAPNEHTCCMDSRRLNAAAHPERVP